MSKVLPRRIKTRLQAVRGLFLILGIASLAFVGYSLLDAKLFQTYANWRFDRAVQHPSSPVAFVQPTTVIALLPTHHELSSAVPVSGSTLGRIEIERLGISVMILEGTEAKTLRRSVGHIVGTALPGEFGNVGLAGHRDTFFRGLRDIQMGDEISLTTLGGLYHYRVKSMEIVPPEDIGVLNNSGGSELTLVTCYPFDFIGPAPKRF